MAKYLNKNYSKVAFGSEGYADLSEFEEIVAEAGSKGELGVIRIDDCIRLRLSKNLYSQLDMPNCVKVLLGNKKIAIKSVPDGTPGAYELGKGAVIYSTSLGDKIINAASDIDFKENATTRIGIINQVQENEDGSITAILSF
ncbi:MAG: hypothetical protein ACI4JM_07495 [Oscillospiraceae bacterium]